MLDLGLDSGPPIDPVLMVIVLQQLVGEDKATDDRISFVMESRAKSVSVYPASETGFLGEHLHDILSSDLAYRKFVFEALVDMYRRSKGDWLKLRLQMISPAIPVHAKYPVEGQNAEDGAPAKGE